MKNKIHYIFICLSILFFSSCDYVNQTYTVPGPNGCTSPEPDFTPRTSPERKVLVEDFTGHKCGNCPMGHVALNNLKNTYGEQVIGIAIHSEKSNLTTPTAANPENKFVYDFRTQAALGIDEQFGIYSIGIPNGLVNRKNFGSSVIVPPAQWNARVTDVLSTPIQMDIQINNFWDPANNSICSYAFIEAKENLSSNYKMVMLITESNIIQWQKYYANTPEEIPDYIHNHVLRTSITSIWGVPVANGEPINSGDTEIQGYSISTVGTDWNINYLYVVAFVYDVATYEVIQVEEVKVIP